MEDYMLSFWLCSAVAIAGALLATFFSEVRQSALALWLAGMGVGGIYLSVGAEFLAIVQWLVSTLVAISFLFYAVLFGGKERGGERNDWMKLTLALVAGGLLVTVVWIGVRHLGRPGVAFERSTSGLLEIGKSLLRDHLLSLEILALTLFLVVVGAGVISRPEVREK